MTRKHMNHWKEFQPGITNTLPNAKMIYGDFLRTTQVKLVGEPRVAPQQTRVAIFDKEYVCQWLEKKVFTPLEGLTKEELFKVMNEAYDIWQEKSKAILDTSTNQ